MSNAENIRYVAREASGLLLGVSHCAVAPQLGHHGVNPTQIRRAVMGLCGGRAGGVVRIHMWFDENDA
jgi:hypothetical protein